ncbi:Uncharacterized protein FWK35_00025283 [Aphis craccivora]|uniref:Helitron helicase-like domain-containing protein n=1 Tax=Aphis craccivora TaxID=307492 RepID=A0A6G0WGL1_APHCR|nr:Uncharacterized protein FWK35_00025283 [Aphis craccivora]
MPRRKSCFKQHYLYQNVIQSLVVSALDDLIIKPLYKDAEIDKDWLAHMSETTKSLENSSDHESDETYDEDTNIEPINPESMDTMIENYDFVSFAPHEGMKPLSILIDDHAEEKDFPDLFSGHLRTNKSPLKNYSKVVRSELLNVDRRFASDSSNLFFKCKVLVQKLIASDVQIVLRKNKKGNTTANDVANPAVLNKMIDNDQGYRMLHNVQNSPSYLGSDEKNVFAMVRQESQPTLFLTFSPTLFKSIKSKNAFFKEHSVKHFFYRVEYQHRGSPHVHMLLWLYNAPVFDPAKPENCGACVTLINKNVRARVSLKLVSSDKQAKKLMMKNIFKDRTIYSENLMAIHQHKETIKFDKAIYVGSTILVVLKTFMENHKNQPGYFKDEMGGKILKEFVSLRPKLHAYKTENNDEVNKVKVDAVQSEKKNMI